MKSSYKLSRIESAAGRVICITWYMAYGFQDAVPVCEKPLR